MNGFKKIVLAGMVIAMVSTTLYATTLSEQVPGDFKISVKGGGAVDLQNFFNMFRIFQEFSAKDLRWSGVLPGPEPGMEGYIKAHTGLLKFTRVGDQNFKLYVYGLREFSIAGPMPPVFPTVTLIKVSCGHGVLLLKPYVDKGYPKLNITGTLTGNVYFYWAIPLPGYPWNPLNPFIYEGPKLTIDVHWEPEPSG